MDMDNPTSFLGDLHNVQEVQQHATQKNSFKKRESKGWASKNELKPYPLELSLYYSKEVIKMFIFF